jgi:hypothetical protein
MRERGQASVELVALAPLLGVLAALCWQAVVAGQAVWLAGGAARAAARAQAVGGDPLRAARAVLPHGLDGRVRVARRGGGAIELALGVPAVVGRARLATIHARAAFAPQGGR